MNVSIHARGQLLGRMPAPEAVTIIKELEEARAPKHSEARIVRRYGEQRSDGQSNGDVLVAIIERGTVVTCYWRRGTQTFTAAGFRVQLPSELSRPQWWCYTKSPALKKSLVVMCLIGLLWAGRGPSW